MNRPHSSPRLDVSFPSVRAVGGAPRVLLRLEGALLLVGALGAYAQLGGTLGWFLALFLLPDLTLLGYALGPRLGAALYDAAHTTLAPGLLAAASLALSAPPEGLLAASIWAAHVGFDRMLGYGLKYASGFADTHLGRIGRVRRAG